MTEESRHDGSHLACPPCFRIKLRTVQFQGIDAGQRRFTDRERTKDMDAYKSMRQQGIQPKHVFGSAEVQAQAETAWEVEHAVIMSDPVRKEFTKSLEESGV
jgi:hypothetical protein